MARKSLAPSIWGRHSSSTSSAKSTPVPSAGLSFSSPTQSLGQFHPTPPLSRSPSQASHFSSNSSQSHPYAAMSAAPLPVISSHNAPEDEAECPVCLEPLSFSFRLPGEKPHIVPECGHALHEACFTAVYGPPPGATRAGIPRKSNLGVCGVCRRPMKVGDGDGGKSNKLAALTGMGDRNGAGVYPGRNTPGTSRVGTRHGTPTPQTYDPNEDDPIEAGGSVKSGHSESNGSHYVVAPSIQVRPEFASLTRSSVATQPLTCIVVIELPSRRNSAHIPGPVISHEPYRSPAPRHDTPSTATSSERSSPRPDSRREGSDQDTRTVRSTAGDDPYSPQESVASQPYSYNATPSGDSPFQAITDDLRNRIYDWKGHPMSGLGPLQMFDILSVRRDTLVREFYVYLFREAIICVLEEKKKTLGRLLSSASGTGSAFSEGSSNPKGVLRLKGRIYIRHIKRVVDTSIANELSLTIDMEDERLESFILIFRDRSSLESWRATVSSLVSSFQNLSSQKPLDIEEFGSPRTTSSKAQRMLSGSSDGTISSGQVDSLLREGSSRSTMSSATSSSQPPSSYGTARLAKIPSEELLHYPSPPPVVTPHMSYGPSNSLTPLQHTPMDLILVISIPPPNSVPSTAQLKLRVIKTTLDFMIASLSSRDRLSLVTFEVGVGGRVRKTPFLALGRAQSRSRLQSFVDTLGGTDEADQFLVRTANEEKTDVVTAVNHGLDVVLQRKSRNPISGLMLVSDASDSTRRAQMDLVLARAEAANIPIHTFGYGRSHDPASLWLMSNHTSGTYTFVKDWYDLRDCLAGCVGGMMSIGLLNIKLHIKVVDGRRFRIRKVSGGPNSILSSEGHDVDVDVGELRYGEKKEMLIELELDNADATMGGRGSQYDQTGSRVLNATDQFVQRMGLDSLSIGDDVNLVDGMMDRMIDEVPVFEVDGSFYDPSATKNVTRLAHPVLLTVTLLPSTNRPAPLPSSDPVIVRRRMELLASDMMTRALVLVSRKNHAQAQKIMGETKRILHTVLQNITQSLPPPSTNGGTLRNRKELLTLSAVRALQSVLQDIQALADALEENVELFAHDHRNFGAQQAMILRDQKSWSGRTATEKLFWTADNSIELVTRSNDWVARD